MSRKRRLEDEDEENVSQQTVLAFLGPILTPRTHVCCQPEEGLLNTLEFFCKKVLGKKIHDESKHDSNTRSLMEFFDTWIDEKGEESVPERKQIASQIYSRCFNESWDMPTNSFTSTPLKIHDDTFSVPAHREVAQDPMELDLQGPGQHDGRQAHPCGIKNQENCCFMIAALQLFHGIPAFRKAIYQICTGFHEIARIQDQYQQAARMSTILPEDQFIHRLQVTFKDMEKKKDNVDILNLANEYAALREALDERYKNPKTVARGYKVGMQHDAHEFAVNMLMIALELGQSSPSDTQESPSRVLGGLVTGSFNIKTTLQDTSIQCESPLRTEVFQGPAELTVEVGTCNVIDAAHLLPKQLLTGSNQYRYGEQGQLANATLKRTFGKLPPVLFVSLKRATSDTYKNPTRVAYTEQMKLVEVVEDLENGACTTRDVTYHLYAVIVHCGPSANSGHYWAYRREGDPTKHSAWYKLDCKSVSICQKSEALENNYGGQASQPTASVLCYVREDKSKEIFTPISEQELRRAMDTIKGARRAFEKYLIHGLSRVAPGKAEHLLCESHEEDPFSRTLIDTTLTSFHEEHISVLKKIYEKMAYKDNKLPYFEEAQFAMRKLDFRNSDQYVENIMYGDCQSGKSAEATWAAWCSWFVMGLLPIVLVRNRGGKVQGTTDMKKAFQLLNERVSQVLTEFHHSNLASCFAFEVITDENVLLSRLSQYIQAKNAGSLMKITPMVYIMLNNPAQMKKLVHGIPGGSQRWCPVRIMSNKEEGKWEVQYLDTLETEMLPEKDIRRGGKEPKIGEHMTARKSDKLRYKESVFAHLNDLLGPKDMRVRALFIVDEGDLAVGGPSRKTNAGDRIHFHDGASGAIVKTLGIRRGAREYAYGSVSITATPAALMLCSWPVQLCGLCQKDMQGGGPAMELKCKLYHRFCIECMQDFLAKVPGDTFQCPACAESQEVADDGEDDSDDDDSQSTEDEDDDDDSYYQVLTKEDIQNITLHQDVRSIRLHIARTDRPRNYAYYEETLEEGESSSEEFVIRREDTVEREDNKRISKLEVYKQIYLGQHGDEWYLGTQEDWNETVELARENGRGDLWDSSVYLRRVNSTKSGASVQVYINRKGSDISRQLSDMATAIHDSLKSCGARSPYEIELQGLFKMLAKIHFDETSAFRHALISSDKTTNILKQEDMQKSLINQFDYMDLAIARYESKHGVTVMFTKTALERRPGLLNQAVEKGRDIYVKEQMRETPCKGRSLRCKAEGQAFLDGNGFFRIKDPNINTTYEVLKAVGCNKSVVITGLIGGRGVSYHDLKHETILTDMYTAMRWEQGKEITLHGEHLIQLVGRLNTIYTRKPVPVITLWAPPSFHTLHKAHISQIKEFVKVVQHSKGSLHEALACMTLYISEVGGDGQAKILRIARGTKFAGHQRKAGGAIREANMPPVRPRTSALKPWEAPPRPEDSLCLLFSHFPYTRSENFSSDHVWDEEEGPFSKIEHITWTVRLPSSCDVHLLRQMFENLTAYCDGDLLQHLSHNVGIEDKMNNVFEVGFMTRIAAYQFLQSDMLVRVLGGSERAQKENMLWKFHLCVATTEEDS